MTWFWVVQGLKYIGALLIKKIQLKQQEKELRKNAFPCGSRTSVKLGSALLTSYLHAWCLTTLSFIRDKKFIIAPKKLLPLWSSICTRSFTRIEDPEAQQTTVSVGEFNDMKNELWNFMHMMSVIMRRFESQAPPPATQDSGSPWAVPLHETPIV